MKTFRSFFVVRQFAVVSSVILPLFFHYAYTKNTKITEDTEKTKEPAANAPKSAEASAERKPCKRMSCAEVRLNFMSFSLLAKLPQKVLTHNCLCVTIQLSRETIKLRSYTMNTLKIGSTTITWEGPQIKRWTKNGKDRLYLERSREYIDLTDEEAAQDVNLSDSYGWNTTREVVRCPDGSPVIIGRTHRYRQSVITVRWADEVVGQNISGFFAALAQFVEQEMAKAEVEEVAEVESVEVVEEPMQAVLVEMSRPFGSHHLEPLETVFKTVKTATRPFTIEEVQRVLLAACPDDEDVQDIARKAGRWIASFENPYSPANRRILKEVEKGVFALR